MRTEIEVSAGELFDKISILELKAELLSDAAKLANVRRELAGLAAVRDRKIVPSARLTELARELAAVNRKLWNIEDAIRECEREQRFDGKFVELARAVYVTNDLRFALKRAIDEHLGSQLVEEKSYC